MHVYVYINIQLHFQSYTNYTLKNIICYLIYELTAMLNNNGNAGCYVGSKLILNNIIYAICPVKFYLRKF